MKKVLEKLLADSPDGAQVNIFTNGVALGGAIRPSKLGGGIYELLTLRPSKGGTPTPVLYYIKGDAIDAIAVPLEDDEEDRSGIVLPGQQH